MGLKLKSGLKMILTIKNFPLYFRDYFKLIPGGEIVYRLRNGINLKVRAKSSDREAMNEVCIYGVYFQNGLGIEKGDVVLDIGGHVGSFSILASRLGAGKVFCFEPDAENYRLLNDNLRLNKVENIDAVKKAVSFENKEKKLFLDSNQEAHSFFSKSNNPQVVKVESIALSDFLKKNKVEKIDFLKMDCEGAEYEILYNCPDKTLGMIKKISMEYHNLNKMLEKRGLEGNAPVNYNGKALAEFLRGRGFDVKVRVYSARRGMIFARQN
jgi:FkbM family methyltransferase